MREMGNRHKKLLLATALVICAILWTGPLGNAGNFVFAMEEPVESIQTVVAHGGGMYREFETSNSVEALINSIENGVQLIELDLSLSRDGKIIMLHDWDRTVEHYLGDRFDKKLYQSQFEGMNIFGILEPLTFDKLTKILTQYPQVKIITDTKEDTLAILEEISKQYPDYQNRMIPQIYAYDELEPVKEMGYEDIIFTAYLQAKPNAKDLISFAQKNNLYGVTMPDYEAKKGLCKAVSSAGIPVFVHPINTFEEAKMFMDMGATGVYSGTLLPEEFTGFEKDYYLTKEDAKGKATKLTDGTFTVKNLDKLLETPKLELYGLSNGDQTKISVDDKEKILTLTVFTKAGVEKGKLTYNFFSSGKQVRIVHPSLKYRLEAEQAPKNFKDTLEEKDIYGESTPEEVSSILENAFIAKSGEHIYYSDGDGFIYKNGEEFFPVGGGINTPFRLPLADTMLHMGADSVYMTASKQVFILYGEGEYIAIANSYYLRDRYRLIKLKSPMSLYLRKSIVQPDFIQAITGRSFIKNQGLLIILPEKTTVSKDLEKQLISFAKKLF